MSQASFYALWQLSVYKVAMLFIDAFRDVIGLHDVKTSHPFCTTGLVPHARIFTVRRGGEASFAIAYALS